MPDGIQHSTIGEQVLKASQPLMDFVLVLERKEDLVMKKAGAHRGTGQIKDPEKGAGALAADDRLGQFKIAPGRIIDNEVSALGQGADFSYMGNIRFLGFLDIG